MIKHLNQKTVGEIINLLEKAPQDWEIRFCNGLYPSTEFGSYRDITKICLF